MGDPCRILVIISSTILVLPLSITDIALFDSGDQFVGSEYPTYLGPYPSFTLS